MKKVYYKYYGKYVYEFMHLAGGHNVIISMWGPRRVKGILFKLPNMSTPVASIETINMFTIKLKVTSLQNMRESRREVT